ncbi:MAG: DUF3313 domain-containing protein [Gammaproteobacteria bacterium]|nr:DUF3313 domain-containing protein [Gammaproteobacteria bacterium]MBT8445281.1 DUF3313 domain-containing protein [Gammaproteobacteria bacterium]
MGIINWRAFVAIFIASIQIIGFEAVAKNETPELTHDGLELVDGTKLDAVYRLPGADFSVYQRVAILECAVAFRKNWQRDQNRDRRGGSRITQDDMDRIKSTLSEEFLKIFSEELEKGGYAVVDAGGEDVLVLRPAIINLDVAAPDILEPGRTRTFSATAGQMTLYMEVFDSVSGAILGRAVDAQGSRTPGRVQISNRVTNKAEADRILRRWAKTLVGKLDAVHGKTGE